MAHGDRFAELLARVAREVTIRQSSEVCCGDLTLEQFQTLRAVSLFEQSSIGSLSTELHVDLSTMSRNVTVLERNGYLIRARSAEDGRIVHVELTTKGKRALNTLRCEEREVLSDVYQRLPPSERPKVLAALESLSTCLEKTENGQACCQPARARKSSS